jgi:PAS domain S-box-containing protein
LEETCPPGTYTETLDESELIFRGFFAHATDAMFLTDEHGIIVEWNQAAEKLFSLPQKDVIGKHIQDIQNLSTLPEQNAPSPLESVPHTNPASRFRSRMNSEISRPDGITIYLEQTIFPIPVNNSYRLANIFRDTTEEHLVEQREQRRHALLEKVIQLGKTVTQITNLQQCYLKIYQCIQQGLDFDRVGLFTYHAAEQNVQGIIGTERTGEIGDKSWVIQKLQPGDTWNEILASPQGIHFVDNSQTTPDQGDNMVGVKENVVVAAWAGETPMGFIGVDNLLTGRKITPEQVDALQLFAGYAGLAIHNALRSEKMEQHVAERTAALESANREMESLSYTIAHDLRSPLRAVVGYSRILQEPRTNEDFGDDATLLKKIHTEGQRMGRMVDDFLFFLHLGRTPLDKQMVDMNALVQRVIQTLQAKNPRRTIHFSVLPIPPCEADPYLMYLLLAELIANAIQFTTTRKNAQIGIGTMQQEGETCYFVRDNGVGFNMAYADKLYGVFERLHHPADFGDTGTGIGLANARRIVIRHGGRIWAEAEEGQGATFYFTIKTP